MTSTTVYRLAHPTAINRYSGTHAGPYSTAATNLSRHPELDASDDVCRPVPYKDGLTIWTDADVCGFLCIEQLLDWFTASDLDELSDCGYVLQMWLAEDEFLQIGDFQVVFRYTRAELVKNTSLEHLRSFQMPARV